MDSPTQEPNEPNPVPWDPEGKTVTPPTSETMRAAAVDSAASVANDSPMTPEQTTALAELDAAIADVQAASLKCEQAGVDMLALAQRFGAMVTG